jgi:hypothetical protein
MTENVCTWKGAINFYKENPFVLMFMVANLLSNLLGALLMSNFETSMGIISSSMRIAVSIALVFSLPIIANTVGQENIKKFSVNAFVIVALLGFSVMDVWLTYISQTGVIEYAKLNEERANAITKIAKDVGEAASSTAQECFGIAKCDSQSRMDTAINSISILQDTKIAWSPHNTMTPEQQDLFIKGLTAVCSLGGVVMGLIAGINGRKPENYQGPEPAKKSPNLRIA